MTARSIYEAVLIELSKVKAPTLTLAEFNYFFNKAINQFINEIYNSYDINQQTTDDLRVLKSELQLEPTKVSLNYPKGSADSQDSTVSGVIPTLTLNNTVKYKSSGATYEVYMPEDYLHLLNCTCVYLLMKQNKCYDVGDFIEIPATRLTADSWSNIMTDLYNRPTPLRPYYYIHNVNSSSTLPTNPIYAAGDTVTNGTDIPAIGYNVETAEAELPQYNISNKSGSNFKRTITLSDKISKEVSIVEKPTAIRYANPTKVRMEIRYGNDDTIYKLVQVRVDYIKSPQFIRLTQTQIDLTDDTSQIMEFPDYVCQEIINKLVTLLLERSSDPRLTNNFQINHTIARPTEQQQQTIQQ